MLCMVVAMQSEGVHIFVLIYKEMEITVGINSFYTKSTLTKLHPNIKVQSLDLLLLGIDALNKTVVSEVLSQ